MMFPTRPSGSLARTLLVVAAMDATTLPALGDLISLQRAHARDDAAGLSVGLRRDLTDEQLKQRELRQRDRIERDAQSEERKNDAWGKRSQESASDDWRKRAQVRMLQETMDSGEDPKDSRDLSIALEERGSGRLRRSAPELIDRQQVLQQANQDPEAAAKAQEERSLLRLDAGKDEVDPKDLRVDFRSAQRGSRLDRQSLSSGMRIASDDPVETGSRLSTGMRLSTGQRLLQQGDQELLRDGDSQELSVANQQLQQVLRLFRGDESDLALSDQVLDQSQTLLQVLDVASQEQQSVLRLADSILQQANEEAEIPQETIIPGPGAMALVALGFAGSTGRRRR